MSLHITLEINSETSPYKRHIEVINTQQSDGIYDAYIVVIDGVARANEIDRLMFERETGSPEALAAEALFIAHLEDRRAERSPSTESEDS